MRVEDLPAELQDLDRLAESVAVERIRSLVPEVERSRTFSPLVRSILGDAGFLGLVVPEAYGGVPSDLRAEVVVVDQVAREYPSAATYLTAHWVATKLVVGADRVNPSERTARLLRDCANGALLGALAATEPESGSDLASVHTRAERHHGGWRLNGSKRFITNGGFCDFYVVLARTGGPGARGLSLFLLDADSSGVRVTRHENKMGMHGSATAEITFDDVLLASEDLLGDENAGFGMLMAGLDDGRVVVAGLCCGLMRAALSHASRYACQRSQFGKRIGEFQAVQLLIADIAIAAETASAVTLDAAQAVIEGSPNASRMASIAKTYASDAAMAATSDAVQVHGGYGYVDDFPVEMLMRDAKINQIYEGTNQLQRVLIARGIMDGAR